MTSECTASTSGLLLFNPGMTDDDDVAAGSSPVVAAGVQGLNLVTAYLLGPKLTSATELYGALGIATTILFWLYIVGRLVIGAAILNATLVDRRVGSAPGA